MTGSLVRLMENVGVFVYIKKSALMLDRVVHLRITRVIMSCCFAMFGYSNLLMDVVQSIP